MVYTTPEILEHKMNDGMDGEGMYCYWSLSRMPKKNVNGDRFYLATKGFVRGFFSIHNVESSELQFFSETWTPIKPIPQKPFQGFKYFDGER